MEDVEKERQRAEVFDALGHPTRIRILKALNEDSLGFSDLKKRVNIESSGHLQHHLGKLDGLITTDEHGKYCLSDQGKDALFAVQAVEKVLQPGAKETEKLIHAFSLKTRAILTSIIVLLAITSLVSGFYGSNAGLMQTQYSYDLVKGSPLKEGAQVSLGTPPTEGHHLTIGGSYEIHPKDSFNYTAKVFFNPVGYGYAGSIYSILDMLSPPMRNSTFYRQSFVGFEMEILNGTGNFMDIFFRPALGPDGRAAEEVVNPYGLPPYNTTTSTGFNATISVSSLFSRTYIVPTNVAGDYTVSVSNIGNSTISGKMTVWPSTVTMETKTLHAWENLPLILESGSGQIPRIYSKLAYPISTFIFAATVLFVSSFSISALCLYLINRKH